MKTDVKLDSDVESAVRSACAPNKPNESDIAILLWSIIYPQVSPVSGSWARRRGVKGAVPKVFFASSCQSTITRTGRSYGTPARIKRMSTFFVQSSIMSFDYRINLKTMCLVDSSRYVRGYNVCIEFQNSCDSLGGGGGGEEQGNRGSGSVGAMGEGRGGRLEHAKKCTCPRVILLADHGVNRKPWHGSARIWQTAVKHVT